MSCCPHRSFDAIRLETDSGKFLKNAVKYFMYSGFPLEKAESILRAYPGPREFFGGRPIREVPARGTETTEDAVKLKQHA